ncbi:MAG: hypothetical protein DRQ02_01275 [Candidatus Latescibacterota bacterium]|nr:MAG: hypothetical protein DRQ02_01275 [Candidatus Latescibacterota bacterium]
MARSFASASSEYLENTVGAPVSGVPLTIAAWVSVTNPFTWTNLIICCIQDKDTSDQMFALEIRNESTVFARALTRQGGTLARAVATNTLSYGTWYLCVATFISSSSRACSVDGANRGTNTTSVTPSGLDSVSIGRYGDSSPGNYFNGKVAEVAVWDTNLSIAETQVLAARFSPLFVRPQNLVSYWSLIRDEDQDRVGGYDMTAYNTPSIATHPPIIYPAPPFIGLGSAVAATRRIFITHI